MCANRPSSIKLPRAINESREFLIGLRGVRCVLVGEIGTAEFVYIYIYIYISFRGRGLG